MATTTNYGWTTPDDTALVKDGASAIRTLGSSVDTTTKNLNPETTLGDIAYRSSTANVKTRLGLGTAGQVLRVNSGGTAPEWATTADQTPLTTKGDLFGFDTADARIPIGTNGQVLTADSTENLGLKWAAPASGALTLISSTTIGTTVATVAITNCFSATYDNYKIIVSGGIASSNPNLDLILGATTTGYYYFNIRSNAYSSVSQSTASNTTSFPFVGSGGPNSLQANFDLLGPNLAKRTQFTGIAHTTNSSSLGFGVVGGFQNSDTQFTGFTLGTGADGTMTGGTIKVYGYSN